MRIAVKYQLLLAPAAVLFILTLLLVFLQYTYWDLSVKRQKSKNLAVAFVSLAEADLAAQRMQGLSQVLKRQHFVDISVLEEMGQLHDHLTSAVAKVTQLLPITDDTRNLLEQSVSDLDTDTGLDSDRFLSALSILRPQLISLLELANKEREKLRKGQTRDIDELVNRTALVSVITLTASILLGTLLALFFARRLLRRIQALSDSAGLIARGELIPPPPPTVVRDELDDLTLSINQMAERLIRVVSAEKLLEGAEEERRRIAMDIHDQTLSDLSGVLRGLQALDDVDENGGCKNSRQRLEQDLSRAITNLREVMDNLHPQTLEILGLAATLESYLERNLDDPNMPEYHLYISPQAEQLDLGRLCQLNLYRIAVEAIHNVIKHSRAERYEVTLDRRNGTLIFSVEDNGIGFDEKRDVQQKSRGVNNIRERAKAIGAQVSWTSSRFTTGTCFKLTLPLGQCS